MRRALIYLALGARLVAQTPSYTINSWVGTDPLGDQAPAREARLLRPRQMVADAQGNVYLCDTGNRRIRRIARDQTIVTIAGGGTDLAANGAVATAVQLNIPHGIALDRTANVLYFGDQGAQVVYALSLASGTLKVVAGGGPYLSSSIGDGGPATSAYLISEGLAFHPELGLLIANPNNSRIRRVDPRTGTISTLAGNGTQGPRGDGGLAIASEMDNPHAVTVAPDGTVYVGEALRIRQIQANGVIRTVAGRNNQFFYLAPRYNGPPLEVDVIPMDLTFATDGTLYITENYLHRVRRLTPAGLLTTVAGTDVGGFAGDGGPASIAQFNSPMSAVVDVSGAVLVADSANHRIRRIDPATTTISPFAGSNRAGRDGLPAELTLLTDPRGVAFDLEGNLYVADTGNHCIRRFARDGVGKVVAGVGGERGTGSDDVTATSSRLNEPESVVVDADGSLYIADTGNQRVRRVSPDGRIRTISGDRSYEVYGLAIDRQRRKLYFSSGFGQVFVLDLANAAELPHRVAGGANDESGDQGDGGPASQALLRSPRGLAIGANGDLYIADRANGRIRRIDPAGVITTAAGERAGFGVEPAIDGPAATTTFSYLSALTIDAQGGLLVAEEGGHRLRRVIAGRVDMLAGSREGRWGLAGDGGSALQSLLSSPAGIAIAGDGRTVALADSANHRIRRLAIVPPAARIEIQSGNQQSGFPGQTLAQALTVRVASATGEPVAGAAVTFVVTAGTATLSAATVNSNAEGLAAVTVTLGATPGPVQVSARTGTLPSITFSLSATTPVVRPVISRGGVIGVGASVPAVSRLAPRGLVSIFGQNFLEAGAAGRRVNFDTELVSGLLPTRLLGVCVEIGGIRAPMLDVFPAQLNVVVPMVVGTSAAVRVIRRCNEADAVVSDPEMVEVAEVAPEFLYAQLNASGRNPVAAVNAITGEVLGPGSFPSRPGGIVTVYATGFGATSPAVVPGGPAGSVAEVTARVRIRLGPVELDPSDILYVGASPGSLIYQVNLRIPPGVPGGEQPIQIFLNSIPSPPNAYLAIAAR